MAEPKQKIVLIVCGSFNPITNMHLRMFETAKDHFQSTGKYEVIHGLISPVHDAYGKQGLVEATHRIQMCRLAVESSPWISVEDWEANQKGWTTTRKVLEHFERTLNEIPTMDTPSKRNKLNNGDPVKTNDSIKVMLLCGGDLLESFAKPGLWKHEDIKAIIQNHGLVVIRRANSDAEGFIYKNDEVYANRHSIHLVTEWFSNDISSTKVRTALRRGESIKYVVQDSVIQYIEINNLYLEKQGDV